MKKIKNGLKDYYYLTEDGKVYNIKRKKYLKAEKNVFTLVQENGKTKKYPLKALYKLVYNKNYCIDDIEDLEGEEWKTIEWAQNYKISNKGRIKSLAAYNSIILKEKYNPNGYSVAYLYDNDNNKIITPVGRIVAEYFLEAPKSANYEVHHKNLIRSDNRAENLCYLSRQEHIALHKKLNQEKKEQ